MDNASLFHIANEFEASQDKTWIMALYYMGSGGIIS